MANGTDNSGRLPSPIRGRPENRLADDVDRPRTASEEKRFAWNGMPLDDARTPKGLPEPKYMNPFLRFIFTGAAMAGVRLDLFRHRSYFIPAVAIFVAGQYYHHWFVNTDVWDDDTKFKIVYSQAACFPFIYYFFLCTFPYWTWKLKHYIGDRMCIIFFNIGMGALWVFNIALFQLIGRYDKWAITQDVISEDILQPLGWALMIVGWITKFWASYILGVASYFYADMIHRQPLEGSTFNMEGPYKWFANPMYGVGYLGSYGLGLLYRSPLAIGMAAIMHIGVWYFNWNVEQKWVNRIYGNTPPSNAQTPPATSPAPFSLDGDSAAAPDSKKSK